jgi:hypothetical protein
MAGEYDEVTITSNQAAVIQWLSQFGLPTPTGSPTEEQRIALEDQDSTTTSSTTITSPAVTSAAAAVATSNAILQVEDDLSSALECGLSTLCIDGFACGIRFGG